jgi:glycerophosphoryl diester phosphodiesterase
MVEFKQGGQASFDRLKEYIATYKQWLTYYENGVKHPGAVSINITGAVPVDLIANEKQRYFTADGSIHHSNAAASKEIIERVSSPYFQFFNWMGIGEMPQSEKQKLDSLVASAHQYGRQIRFYACPNNTKIWKALLDAGVDWINIDDYAKFARFHKRYITEKMKR